MQCASKREITVICDSGLLNNRYQIYTCSKYCVFQTHLPGYIEKYDEIKGKGVDVVACVAVNDPFVMGAWGKDQKADGKVNTITLYQFSILSLSTGLKFIKHTQRHASLWCTLK